jgi:hypothetical protein
MNNAKQTLVKIRNHIAANKVAYVASTVAATAVVLQQRNNRQFSKFLTSKGIDPDEFYCPEAYEEKMNVN